jgi:hypothetical protein
MFSLLRSHYLFAVGLVLCSFSWAAVAKNTIETDFSKVKSKVIPKAQSSAAAVKDNTAQHVQTRIQFLTLESTIVGNKEQPKIITIVPWQTPQQNRIETRPIAAQIKSVFEPVEVESVKKELEYFHRYN